MATVDQQIDALLKRGKNPARPMYLWRYNKTTGCWRVAREVNPETAKQWLQIFQDDEPEVKFKLSRNKPANVTKSRKVTLVAANPRKAKSRLTCDEYETQYSKDGKTWNRWNVVCYEDMARKIARDVSRDFPAYSVRVVKL